MFLKSRITFRKTKNLTCILPKPQRFHIWLRRMGSAVNGSSVTAKPRETFALTSVRQLFSFLINIIFSLQLVLTVLCCLPQQSHLIKVICCSIPALTHTISILEPWCWRIYSCHLVQLFLKSLCDEKLITGQVVTLLLSTFIPDTWGTGSPAKRHEIVARTRPLFKFHQQW